MNFKNLQSLQYSKLNIKLIDSLTQLTIKEQIYLFMKTKIHLSYNGAHQANFIFMDRNSYLIDFARMNYNP